MTETLEEIKEFVCVKLWDLFKEKCPYFNRHPYIYWKEQNCNPYGFKANENQFGEYDVSLDEWTILTKILPSSINEYELRYCPHDYHLNYDECEPCDSLFKNISFPNNFWQSLLGLLEGIKSYPDRDNFQYKWGDKE